MMTTTVMIKPNQTNPTKCQGQEQKKYKTKSKTALNQFLVDIAKIASASTLLHTPNNSKI